MAAGGEVACQYEGKTGGARVLVVDDEEFVRDVMVRTLEEEFQVCAVASGEQAERCLHLEPPDVLLVDKNLEDLSGIELLRRAKQICPDAEVLIITAYASLESAIEAFQLGAFDYVTKPFDHVSVIEAKIHQAAEKKRLVEEQRDIQTRLAQSDRMASIGMLAAGVAHEINNPLAYVLYNLQSLEQDLPRLMAGLSHSWSVLVAQLGPERALQALGEARDFCEQGMLDDVVERAREAAEGAGRIRSIVRDLKTFARDDEDKRVPVNLNQVIDVASAMAHNEIKFRARLTKDLAGIPPVMGSEGRMSQVFLNLMVNAAHAIEEGDVDHNEIRVRTWTQDDEVLAEVLDTGRGIPAEHLGRLFVPFFTTKPVGLGSGLGLSICHNIIDSLGGSIEVENRPEGGSRFLVRLPVARPDPKPRMEAQSTTDGDEEPGTASAGRILVVDDEPMIGTTIRRMLPDHHEVVVAGSGREAMEIIERDDSFDLILSDLIMPRGSGMELHAWLEERHPGLARRCVFITGGAFTPKAQQFLQRVDNLRMDKPLDPAQLRALVCDRMAHFPKEN